MRSNQYLVASYCKFYGLNQYDHSTLGASCDKFQIMSGLYFLSQHAELVFTFSSVSGRVD